MIGHSMGGYITLAFAEKYPRPAYGVLVFFILLHLQTAKKRKQPGAAALRFIQTHGSYEFIKQSTPNLFTDDYRIKNNVILAEMIARYSSFDPLALTAYYEAMIKRPDRTTVFQIL